MITSDNSISDHTTSQMFSTNIPFKKASTNFPPYLTARACTVTCAIYIDT